jgi:hypothetical protein
MMGKKSSLQSIYAMLGGHIMVVLLVVIVGIVYLPRFFMTPTELMHAYSRDCSYAIDSNLSLEKKCSALQKSFEELRLTLQKDDFAYLTFVLARYNYVTNKIPKALLYCKESIPVWFALADWWKDDSDYAKYKRESYLDKAAQCEKMIKKHTELRK